MKSLTGRRFGAITLVVAVGLAVLLTGSMTAIADTTPQSLPFTQSWTNTGLITTNDDWSGVPSVEGYRGQGITTSTSTDPQTLLTTSSVANDLDVIANQTDTALTTGGVAEFELANPTIALQGSGTATAPYILFTLDTTGLSSITASYDLRDIDGTTDNAVQPVALQYRVGASGNFTNVPAGFVADATTGPSLATLVTPVNATLPANVDDQPLVQVRVITSNAVGSDEWVGIDDISVTGSVADQAPTVDATSPANDATNVPVDSNVTVTFSEPVNVSGSWFKISCASSGPHTATVSDGPTAFTLDPASDLSPGETCTVTVLAANVTDQDTDDPPDTMESNAVWTFTTAKASTSLSSVAGGTVVIGSGSKLTDSATLSGGSSPTGTITFTLHSPSNVIEYTDVVAVSGNGTYTTTAGNNPGGYLPTVAGTYLWSATYSGDPNNNPASDNGQNEGQTVTPDFNDPLINLYNSVKNTPPGRALGDKVKQIQAYMAANNKVGACAGLNNFVSLVKAQKGKKLTNAQVTDFISQANAIKTTLGC